MKQKATFLIEGTFRKATISFQAIILLVAMFFSLALVYPAQAATTVVTGDVSGTWDAAGSPYLVEGDVTVPAGTSLTIEPGVQIIFQSWYSLTVNGTLQADGTDNAPVLFSAPDGGPGWPGIRFVGASDSSRLTHVIVERGRATGASPLNLGGGIYIENSSPTVRYSTIRDNFAIKGGGGIALIQSNAILTGNTFINNHAGQGGSASGGGLYLSYSNPQLTGNFILDNGVGVAGTYSTPYGLGGGIFADHSNPVLTGNLIAGNYVDASANSYARGGALYLNVSDPDLINNTITNNTIGSGGGDYSIKEGGGIYAYLSDLTIVNTLLWNEGQQEIFVNGSVPSSISVGYSDIQDGQAGVVLNGATVNLLGGNLNTDPLFSDPTNRDFSLQSGSPAIDAGTAYLEWQGRVLVDLASSDYAGSAPDMGAFEFGSAGAANQPPTAVASATPDHGSAPLTVQFSSAGSSDPDGSIVAYAWDFGDGSSSTGANPSHTYTSVATFQATLRVTDDDGASHSAVLGIDVVDGTTFWGGDVTGAWTLDGSPYRIEGDITVPAGQTLSIEPGVQVIFQSWYQFIVNGTLQADGTDTAPILFSAVDGSPGWLGIRFIGASDTSTLSYAIVEKGHATGASPLNYGGGIYIENSSPTISNSVISDNFAIRSGGGLYLSGSNARLIGNTIANNHVGQGGSASGAGIYLVDSNPEVTGNIIRDNSLGVASTYTSPNGYGGGIYADHSNPILTGNLIADNTISASGSSNARGGALYLTGSDPTLINNTITGNQLTASAGDYSAAEGAGIYAYLSNPVLVNNILWNDTPQETFANGSVPSSLTVAYSDLQGGQASIVANGATINWLSGNLDADPRFVDAVNGDFSLQSGSPAVDAGTDFFEWQGSVLVNLSSTDYNGLAPDMGAFESTYTGTANQPPLAQISATPDTGEAPLIVQFNSSGSSDPDGSVVAYSWDFGDGNSSNLANPSYTYNTAGVYQVTLTVVDDRGATGSASLTVTVSDPVVYEIHVQDQTVTRITNSRRWHMATDMVLVTDQNNQPVAGVVVTATYSGPGQGQASATTDSNGIATLSSDLVRKNKDTWCFEVTSMDKAGYVYNPNANVVTIQCENN
jgi:PKD repeat protein